MKKTILITCVILAIFALCFIFAKPKTNETSANNINKNNVNNNVNENEVSNVVNEMTNEVMLNEIVEDTNTVSSETFEESPKTDEEKAIDMVKKDWGTTNNVNFSMQGMDENGRFIIVVTNSQTKVLAFYTVNVKNNTLEKEITY